MNCECTTNAFQNRIINVGKSFLHIPYMFSALVSFLILNGLNELCRDVEKIHILLLVLCYFSY